VAQKDTKKKTAPSKGEREAKRVAPVSKRLLVGVVVLCAGGLLASSRASNDWVAIAGCTLMLTIGFLIFEFGGRKEAERHPHPMYEPGRLPVPEDKKTRIFAMVCTASVLIVIVAATVGPNREPSPFPFFLAAEYLFLILPQTQARRALKEYNAAHVAREHGEEGKKKKRLGKGKKKKKHRH
jgi:hypothetical protein